MREWATGGLRWWRMFLEPPPKTKLGSKLNALYQACLKPSTPSKPWAKACLSCRACVSDDKFDLRWYVCHLPSASFRASLLCKNNHLLITGLALVTKDSPSQQQNQQPAEPAYKARLFAALWNIRPSSAFGHETSLPLILVNPNH